MNLLQRINAVRKAMPYIQKNARVDNKYSAVTHDAVTAMVRPLLIEHGIVSWPTLVNSVSCPREEGSKQFRHEATYDFVFANIDEPTDCLTIRIIGHAMDNADKAPGKALSYAKKYAILKLFEIETGEDDESRFNPEGLDDGEFDTHLKAINAATDEISLKKAFTAAYKAADEAKDKEASKLFIKSKDARKVALAA